MCIVVYFQVAIIHIFSYNTIGINHEIGHDAPETKGGIMRGLFDSLKAKREEKQEQKQKEREV